MPGPGTWRLPFSGTTESSSALGSDSGRPEENQNADRLPWIAVDKQRGQSD